MKGSRTNYTSGFVPTSIPGCTLWLDAADRSTMTFSSGSNISQWNDKSGNARHATQSTSGNQPTYTSNAVVFNGTSSFLNMTDAYNMLNSTGRTYTFFVVERRGNIATSGYFVAGGGSVGNYGIHFGYNNSTSVRHTYAYVSDLDYTIGARANPDPIRIWAAGYSGSVRDIMINGTLGSTQSYTSGGLAGWTQPVIGFLPLASINTYYAGQMYEILCFNTYLTTLQRQQVEGYLAHKWGLQITNSLLYAGHPYSSTSFSFTPTSITGCTLWLDAADSASITLSGNNVTQWRDKSGNGYHAVSAGTSSPTVTSNFVGSYSGIRTGPNVYLSNASFSMSLASRTVFIVMSSYSTTINTLGVAQLGIVPSGSIYAVDATNTAVYQATQPSYNYQFSWLYRIFAGGGYFIQYPSNATSLTLTPLGIYGETLGSLTHNAYVNSSTISTTTITATPVTCTGYLIAARYDSSIQQGFPGTYGEMLVYNRQLTTTERQQVEGYLAWKWGSRTTVLPSTNPYASIPPVLRPFVPVDISGCSLWLDAADRNTITFSTGSNVSAWNDKSGNGNNMTTQNGNPVYSTTLIGGLPGMDLTNNSGFISAATSTLTSSLTLAMILVVKSGIQNWGSFFTHGGRDFDFALERNSITAGTSLLHFQTANDNTNGDIAYTTDQIALYSGTMTAGTSRYFQRISGGTSTSVTATNTSSITVGSQTIRIGRSDGGEACSSHIGEIVYYNTALTSAQRQQLETYLVNKWGLRGSTPAGHYARLAPALSPSFVPTSIAGCTLWLDAADRTTFTLSGSSVSQWNDKSGNARHATQSTTANQPTYASNAITFDGTTSFFNMTDAYNMLNSTGRTYTFFVVEKRGSGAALMIGGGGSGNSSLLFGYISDTAVRQTIVAGPYDQDYTVPGWANPDPIRLWGGGYSGAVRDIVLNGTTVASQAFSTTLPVWTQAAIGFMPLLNINAYYKGQIYELLFFNFYLTTPQRQQVEGYLAAKWGVRTSLPSNHPYRLTKP